jgi:hypothetical protein
LTASRRSQFKLKTKRADLIRRVFCWSSAFRLSENTPEQFKNFCIRQLDVFFNQPKRWEFGNPVPPTLTLSHREREQPLGTFLLFNATEQKAAVDLPGD